MSPVTYGMGESTVKGIPKYRLHRASGLAVVTLGARDHYLGKYDSPSSKAEYLSRIAEWQASGGSEPVEHATIGDLVDKYIIRSKAYYVKRGKPTSSLNRVVRICELLRDLYGPMAVGKFGVEHWHPHQLRHNAATEVRRRYGVEASQLLLGHASANTTEIYAEKNLDAVSRIAAEVG